MKRNNFFEEKEFEPWNVKKFFPKIKDILSSLVESIPPLMTSHTLS